MKRTTLTMGAAALLAALAAAGCFNPFRPLVGQGQAVTEPAPQPSSPAGVLQLLRWCWNNQSIGEYEDIFTANYEFAFADVEAVDNLPILRDEEIDIARRLFVDGTVSQPRAKRIDLEYSSTLIAIPDRRPGKIDPWHKEITTQIVLRAELQDVTYDIEGNVTFFVVRGDSAQIPTVLVQRGFKPDAHRWYIERWEDHTNTGGGQGGSSALPVRPGAGALGATGGAPVAGVPASSRTPRTLDSSPVYSITLGDLMRIYRTP